MVVDAWQGVKGTEILLCSTDQCEHPLLTNDKEFMPTPSGNFQKPVQDPSVEPLSIPWILGVAFPLGISVPCILGLVLFTFTQKPT